MKYGCLFGLLAVSFAAAVAQFSGALLILLWPTLILFLLSFSYFTESPALFAKRPDGTIPLWSQVLWAPYLLPTWTVWHLVRTLSKEPSYNEITPQLAVGRRLLAAEYVPTLGVVPDLTAEFAEPAGIVAACEEYISFPILDASTPKPDQVIDLVKRIG